MAMVLSECGEPSVHAGNEEVKLTIRNVLVEHKLERPSWDATLLSEFNLQNFICKIY